MQAKPRPLPIRPRPYHRETLNSYAARLASANAYTVQELEGIARNEGWLTTQARHSDQRTELWRAFGRLDRDTLTTPTVTGRNKYRPHPLCLRCTQGTPVHGWLAESGVICLRHRMAHAHTVIRATTEQIQAERDYRNHLVPAGLHPHHRRIAAAHAVALFENQQPLDPEAAYQALDLLNFYPDTVRIAIDTLNRRPATRHEPRPKILRVA